MQYNFEWNPQKAKTNTKKHRVNFEEAVTIFKDPSAVSLFDEDHSDLEERWVTMGLTSNRNFCVVHHTYLQIDNSTVKIRIISCRKATKKEEKMYRG